jgi:large subunit ribosomal protein L21
MFAVIKTGGKQYKVAADDVIEIEKLDLDEGAEVTFDTVLMLGDGEAVTVGAPTVDGAGVKGEVLAQFRGEKVVTFKRRRRKHSSKRRKGHRQHLTRVKIMEIMASGVARAAE